MPTLAHRLLDRVLTHGTVTGVRNVTPRVIGVRIAAEGLRWTPGQQVRVLVGGGGLGTRRTYSVRDYDGAAFELFVLQHGDGPGAAWARGVREGEEVLFSGPEGRFVPQVGAAYHLFAGEETAAAAFGPMIAALAGAGHHAVIEVDTAEDRIPVEGDVTWTYRHGTPAADSPGLLEALRGLDLPEEPGVAYLAGEARTVQSLRRHLVTERGWPRRAVLTKPFWAPGTRGLE
jgi:NADPH-dependent ferric siderophore reductase